MLYLMFSYCWVVVVNLCPLNWIQGCSIGRVLSMRLGRVLSSFGVMIGGVRMGAGVS